MRNNVKNNETKLPPLGINIKFEWWLIVAVGLIYACGVTFTTVAGIYLGYKILRLVVRLIGVAISCVFILVLIIILVAIVSLLTF